MFTTSKQRAARLRLSGKPSRTGLEFGMMKCIGPLETWFSMITADHKPLFLSVFILSCEGLVPLAAAGRRTIRWRLAGLRHLGTTYSALLREAVQGLPNLIQPLVLPPANDIPDIRAELDVVPSVLQQETLDIRHVVVQLVVLPRDVESCLSAIRGDAKRGTVDQTNLVNRKVLQTAIEGFSNLDRGC